MTTQLTMSTADIASLRKRIEAGERLASICLKDGVSALRQLLTNACTTRDLNFLSRAGGTEIERLISFLDELRAPSVKQMRTASTLLSTRPPCQEVKEAQPLIGRITLQQRRSLMTTRDFKRRMSSMSPIAASRLIGIS